MTRSAIVLWGCAGSAAIAAVAGSSPAAAQRAVTDETVTVGDVAKTPLQDLNLAKDPIPPVLLRAKDAPYRNASLSQCVDVRNEIGDLDAVLGEDVDMLAAEKRAGLPVGQVAQQVIGMLIPYRSVIRHLSGANQHEAEFEKAIVAGMMRRAYLKGLGEAMGCPYPARPATPEMIAAQILRRQEAAQEEATAGREVSVEGSSERSEQAVQPTP